MVSEIQLKSLETLFGTAYGKSLMLLLGMVLSLLLVSQSFLKSKIVNHLSKSHCQHGVSSIDKAILPGIGIAIIKALLELILSESGFKSWEPTNVSIELMHLVIEGLHRHLSELASIVKLLKSFMVIIISSIIAIKSRRQSSKLAGVSALLITELLSEFCMS